MEKNLHENVVQRELKPMNGMVMLILISIGLLASLAMIIGGAICLENYMNVIGAVLLIAGVLGAIAFPILYAGLKVVGPNEALVLTLFGRYVGTMKDEGFFFVNPFCVSVNPAARTKLNQSGDVSSASSTALSTFSIAAV